MAGVDVDTSVVKPVIGMSSRTGRKPLLLRLPRRGLERALELEEKKPFKVPSPPNSPPKYKDHSVVSIIGRTLEGQGIPEEELCKPWKNIDLKKKKRKKNHEGDCPEGGLSKKKTKTGGQSKPSKVSFTFTFKPPKESPAYNSGTESHKTVGSSPGTGDSQCKLPEKLEAPAKVQSNETHSAAPHGSSEIRMVDHCTQADLDRGNMRAERGIQCAGVEDERSKNNAHAGPSSSNTPSLETSLARVHECLANIDAGTCKDSKELWKEGSQLQDQSVRNCEKEKAVSVESISLKIQAAMKYMESGIHSKKRISKDIMFRVGNFLYLVAQKYAKEVVADDFSCKCFATLAQRLGVCAHMQYCQLAEEIDGKVQRIIEQSFKMAASTTRELSELREQRQSLNTCENSIVVLIESLLRNSGLGPVEQHLYITGKVIEKLKDRR